MEKLYFTVLLTIGTTTAFAHSGVKDLQVMARMQLMSAIADDMKVLDGIAKGSTPFQAEIARKHGDSLASHASGINPSFKVKATDPKSEARDEIWTDWDGFSNLSVDMRAASNRLANSTSIAEFQAAFTDVGQTCSACHKDYRIKKN